MIRVGLWEGLMKGETSAIVNLVVFQYHCAMIFWSHWKCMTSEPGVLPKNYDTLSFRKMAPPMKEAMLGVKKQSAEMAVDQAGQEMKIKKIEAQISE